MVTTHTIWDITRRTPSSYKLRKWVDHMRFVKMSSSHGCFMGWFGFITSIPHHFGLLQFIMRTYETSVDTPEICPRPVCCELFPGRTTIWRGCVSPLYFSRCVEVRDSGTSPRIFKVSIHSSEATCRKPWALSWSNRAVQIRYGRSSSEPRKMFQMIPSGNDSHSETYRNHHV